MVFGRRPSRCSFSLAALRWGDASGPERSTAASPLVGTWTLVLVDNVRPDGSRIHLYGPSPSGLLMFDAGGRYGLQIVSAGRPAFAANDKGRGTADEYQAAVKGSNAHFGTYAVDQAKGTITFRIEHASFPNWEGTEQKRAFTLVGDHLKYTVPVPTTGDGAVGEVEWRRVPASPRLRARPHAVRGRDPCLRGGRPREPAASRRRRLHRQLFDPKLDQRGCRFPRRTVLNRGFGGSTLADVVYYMDRILLPYRPRLVVLYAGDNDLAAGRTPERVLGDYRAFVARLRAACLLRAWSSSRSSRAPRAAPTSPGCGRRTNASGRYRARYPADLRRRLHADARCRRAAAARAVRGRQPPHDAGGLPALARAPRAGRALARGGRPLEAA